MYAHDENGLKTAQNDVKGGEIKLLRNYTPSPTSEILGSEIKLPPLVAKLNSSENFFLSGMQNNQQRPAKGLGIKKNCIHN